MSVAARRGRERAVALSAQEHIFRLVGRLYGAAMTTVVDMLKPTEAAVVARVALRDVNRAIDEHILPEGFFSVDDGRRVMATACALISFYFDSAKHLTSEERLFAIRGGRIAPAQVPLLGLIFTAGKGLDGSR